MSKATSYRIKLSVATDGGVAVPTGAHHRAAC
jgi:hypothetical protein